MQLEFRRRVKTQAALPNVRHSAAGVFSPADDDSDEKREG